MWLFFGDDGDERAPGVARVYRRLSQWIFVLLTFFSTFAGDVVRFLGNQSAVDNFKLMETDVNFLLIGAT